jgi:hypothetical protein
MRTGEMVTDGEEVIATESGYIKSIFTRKILLLKERHISLSFKFDRNHYVIQNYDEYWRKAKF